MPTAAVTGGASDPASRSSSSTQPQGMEGVALDLDMGVSWCVLS